jgi:hypothetical protein
MGEDGGFGGQQSALVSLEQAIPPSFVHFLDGFFQSSHTLLKIIRNVLSRALGVVGLSLGSPCYDWK